MSQFKAGDYVISEAGKKYWLLDTANLNFEKRLFTCTAFDEQEDKKCFLKFMWYDKKNEATIHNLDRESRFKFYYPYIEHVYESFFGKDPEGIPVYGVSVEFIDGVDLREYCAKQQEMLAKGALDKSQFESRLFRQILQFLYGVNYYTSYAKQEYLHRDLKPENIMISNTGDVMIIDFDFAHISRSKNTEQLKNWELGVSRGYTDPRSINYPYITDKMSDIYSCGRVLFFWMNGYDYFSNEEIGLVSNRSIEVRNSEYCRDLELGFGLETKRFAEKYQTEEYAGIREIIRKMCCDPVRGERYSKVEDIISDMKNFLLKYYGNSRQYEAALRMKEWPLLQNRDNRKFELAATVAYKIFLPGEESQGHRLLEYSMRNIEIKNKHYMTIYNLNGIIYYIPITGISRLEGERTEEDFVIHSGDIFLADGIRIQFTINCMGGER